LLYLRCFASEQAQYNDLFNKGHLSEGALRSLLHVLVQQIDNLRFQGKHCTVRQDKLPPHQLLKNFHHLMDRVFGSAEFMEHLRLEYIVTTYEEAWGHYHACQAVLKDLDKLQNLTGLDQTVVNKVREQYRQWQTHAKESINVMSEQYPEFVSAMQERLGMRLILLAEVQAIRDEARHGIIPQSMAQQMEDELYQRLWQLRGQEIARLRVEPEELLKKVPFFADTTEEDFLILSRKMKRHSLAGGETVIRQGERGDSLYLIARGVVRISRELDGEHHDLTSLFAGDFFGEMALLHDDVRTATVTTVSPCTFYMLDRTSVEEVMLHHPAIRTALEAADQRRRQNTPEQTQT